MTTQALFGRLLTLVRRKAFPVCVMLPGAGGGLNPYLRLASFLSQSYGVYAVRAAGLLPEETPETSVGQMADSVVDAMETAGVQPSLVFGWSLGGTIGWEVCVRLADRGLTPDLVIVDSSPLARPSTVEADARIRDIIVGMLGPRPSKDTLDRVVHTFQAQVDALADYEAVREYAGRVLLLMCRGEDFDGQAESVRRWRSLAPNLRCGELDAGHFEVFEQANLPQLTGAIGDFLGVAVTP
jgi:surfactin synthase thioesterase subunit